MKLTVDGRTVFATTGGTEFDPAKPAIVHAKGCGCASEIAGGDTGALLLVLAVLVRRKRRRVR